MREQTARPELCLFRNFGDCGGYQPEHNIRIAAGLKTLKFGLAFDDFGSGAPSFDSSEILPADYLKNDGTFDGGILKDELDCAIVEATAKVTSAMELKTSGAMPNCLVPTAS